MVNFVEFNEPYNNKNMLSLFLITVAQNLYKAIENYKKKKKKKAQLVKIWNNNWFSLISTSNH